MMIANDYQVSGLFPVQAEGHIDDRSLYFRARGKHWTFAVSLDGRDPVTIDRPGEGFFRDGAWDPDSDEDPHERAKDIIERFGKEFIDLLDGGLPTGFISNSAAVFLDGFYQSEGGVPCIVLANGMPCYFSNPVNVGIPCGAKQWPYRYFGCASVGHTVDNKFGFVSLVLTDTGLIRNTDRLRFDGYVDYQTWFSENVPIGPGGMPPMGREAPS